MPGLPIPIAGDTGEPRPVAIMLAIRASVVIKIDVES